MDQGVMRNKLTPQLFDNLAVANKFFIGHIVLGGQGLQPHMIFDSILISLQVLDKPLMLEAGRGVLEYTENFSCYDSCPWTAAK